MTTETRDAIRRLAAGEERALDELYPLVYDDLRRVAKGHLAREHPDHTLGATALVHESYLRLVGATSIDADSRAHFLSIAARAMRRILVDHARKRDALKRGAGVAAEPLPSAMAAAVEGSSDLLALDEALARLEKLDARQSKVIECRVFGGMTVEETAKILGVSPATVKRDWTLARAWLNRQLNGD